MDLNALSNTSNIDKVSDGEGFIKNRTIEIGNTVIVIENIGTLSILKGDKNKIQLIFSAILCIVGLILIGSSNSVGLIVIILGAALGAWWFISAPDSFLLIGTNDGRRTHIVSKKIEFLETVQNIIQTKIDTSSNDGAVINVSTGHVTGALVIGNNSTAAGQSASIKY